MEVKIATTTEDINKTWDVMYLLRPHLQKEKYVATIKEMFTEGYQMAYIEEDGKAVSVIGYRYLQYLFNGKHIYIDDLSTLESGRGKGYAGKLIDHVAQLAKERGYEVITLDSGCQRHTAHRLYMNKGFVIHGYHFSKKL